MTQIDGVGFALTLRLHLVGIIFGEYLIHSLWPVVYAPKSLSSTDGDFVICGDNNFGVST